MMRIAFLIGLVLAALSVLTPTGVDAKSASYTRFDVLLELGTDGTYHVTETQEVRFVDGPFSLGHREIPLARTEGIEHVTVSMIDENGVKTPLTSTDLSGLAEAPNRYNVRETSTDVRILWAFEPIYSGTRTFVVEYDVLGALRYYPDEDPPNQQIWWTAIGSDLSSETRVNASTVTIVLPEAVALDSPTLKLGEDGKDIPSEHSTDGQIFRWTQTDIDGGEEFTVRMQFPPIVAGIDPPSWQAADDEQRAKDAKVESREAFIHLMMIGIGLALVAGGGSTLYGLWYMRGRDPHAGVVADFLPTPPDDLPPGVVGALLDEHADEADVVATLVDLGRRGVIKITDVGLMEPSRRALGHDYHFELVDPGAKLTAFEQPLIKALFGSSPKAGETARLADARWKVVAAYPAVKDGLYDELVSHGLFPRSPESTRDGWRKTGVIVIIAAIALSLIGIVAEGWWAVFPAVVAVALGGVLYKMGKMMPRKTAQGAEAAARWRAFRRYLDDIDGYEKVSESREIFDRYLAYAVAFGIDTGWVKKFAAVDTASPGWFESVGDVFSSPTIRPSGGYGSWTTGSGSGGGGGDIDLPDIDLPKMPSMQGASNRASSGIQQGSSGFSDLLNVAGAIFAILDIFSGGGGSGGSSGGGGGGFS
jgi:hypothetical protein